jgi:hypothetical protein
MADAIVVSSRANPGQEPALGPIRLPLHRPQDFIDQFNRTYQGLGLRLAALAPTPCTTAVVVGETGSQEKNNPRQNESWRGS